MEEHFVTKLQKQRAMPHMLVLEHVSPATRLLEKRRQMFEVHEVLNQQKATFEQKEEVYKRQEEALKKKDLDLQASLIKFSKFLQENDSKIGRAEKKAKEEITLRQQKEAEIQKLQSTLDQLRAECDNVNDVVEQNMKYQHYLNSVVDAESDISEIHELLLRHATLVQTNADLKEHERKLGDDMETLSMDLNAYVKAKTNEILALNDTIAERKTRLESIKMEASDQEGLKDASLQQTSHNTLEYGQVIMSTENLYHRVKLKSTVGHPDQLRNPIEQLEHIGNFVSDLGATLAAWSKRGQA